MQSTKSWVTPLLIAMVLGLGFGLGIARDAQASACTNECNAEFQACLDESASNVNHYPGLYRCKTWRAACLRACG